MQAVAETAPVDPKRVIIGVIFLLAGALILVNGSLALLVAAVALSLFCFTGWSLWLSAIYLVGGVAGMWKFGGIVTTTDPLGKYYEGETWANPFWELWIWNAGEWSNVAFDHVRAGTLDLLALDWLLFYDAPLFLLNGFSGLFAAGMIGGGGLLAELIDPVKRQYNQDRRRIKAARKTETRNMKRADRRDSTLLGKTPRREPVYVPDSALNKGLGVSGSTGSGKTTTVKTIVKSFIDRGHPVIYVDGKGETALGRAIVGHAAARGREHWCFDALNVAESDAYDPLKSGGPTSLADRLLTLDTWSEDYYRRLATGYLQTVFGVLEACEVRPTLPTVSEYLSTDKLLELLHQNAERIGKGWAKRLADQIANQQGAAEKNADNVRSVVNNLTTSDVGDLFRVDGPRRVLELDAVLRSNGVAYFGLSALAWPKMSESLGRMIVNDLKATLAQAGAPKVLIVLDEFGIFAGDQVWNLVSQGRGFGGHVVLTIQSLADIGKAAQGNPQQFIRQILANLNTYIVHQVVTPEDAETFAQLFGTRESYGTTHQLGPEGATGVGSVRSVRDFRIHPDSFKQFGTGEAALLDKANNRVVPRFNVTPPILFQPGELEK